MTAAVEVVQDETLVLDYMNGEIVAEMARTRHPAELIEAIRRLYTSGYDDVAIATRVGRTPTAVGQIRCRNGIVAYHTAHPRKHRGWPDDLLQHRGKNPNGSLKRESDRWPTRP